MTGFRNKLSLYKSVSYKLLLTNIASKLLNTLQDKSKKTIIDSGITKQKDIKLAIQMKCNLEL